MVVKQLIAVAIAIAAVLFLMQLPKVIINKENKTKLADNRNSVPNTDVLKKIPSIEKTATWTEKVNRLRNFYNKSTSLEKKCTFADSLAKLYLSVLETDSAVSYADRIVLLTSGKSFSKYAADIYFAAFNLVQDPIQATAYSEKARQAYQAALQSNPNDLEAKNNLAMTYVTSENPMQAIMLLREVLKADSNNLSANFNLGYLSVLSGQYDRAINRFEKLLKSNPRFWKARLYYGIALKESGQKELANKQFADVISNERDPALVAEAENQLKN